MNKKNWLLVSCACLQDATQLMQLFHINKNNTRVLDLEGSSPEYSIQNYYPSDQLP